jgi:hypothetical protein
MNPYMCTQSATITSLYLHTLVYIPYSYTNFHNFCCFFLQNTLQNQRCSVPQYFEGDCTTHICKTYAVVCCCCKIANPRLNITQRVVRVYFLRADTNLSLYNLTCWLILTQHTVLQTFRGRQKQDWLCLLQSKVSLPNRHTTPTRWNRKKEGRNNPRSQSVLLHPPRGVHVEWNWKVCPQPKLTFQTVIILTAGFKPQ